MFKLSSVSLVFVSSLMLGGCSQSIFDNEARCPFVDKGGCQSMEMVNRMVTDRRFTKDGAFVQHFIQAKETQKVRSKKTKKVTVWLAPWVEPSGQSHSGHTQLVRISGEQERGA